MTAESLEAVEAFYQGDPFWTQGLRQGCEILHGSKAFPGRKVEL